MVIGTLIAMVFRLWAFRRWVFPAKDERAPEEVRKREGFDQAA
ncbi:hypothetical protein ACQPZF_26080 [Actinosynnema sp. CS-041913]